MSTYLNKERDAFEAWAASVGYDVNTFMAEGETTYSATFANVAWEAWQAARAQPVAAIPEATGEPMLQYEQEGGSTTYKQYAKDALPGWAKNVRPYVEPTAIPEAGQSVPYDNLQAFGIKVGYEIGGWINSNDPMPDVERIVTNMLASMLADSGSGEKS